MTYSTNNPHNGRKSDVCKQSDMNDVRLGFQESNPQRVEKLDSGSWDIDGVQFGIRVLSLRIFNSDS